ncbi:MAG: DegT/DnrJ/EryC1/StrS family aminotransferase [Synechococcales bacterium]|nr:DegT/DnrJ/EryC1/StrS family aminotransferase [Synechococcales bacterium]
MTTIPPFDLSQQFQLIGDEINQAVLQVLASGRYIGGAVVEGFEQQLAQYIGTQHCVACNSGTDALYLALRALGIGAGDEVITSPFTFIATAETISATGATPIFIDIDPVTFNLDLRQLEAAITPQTKAIIPVHLFGHPVDMTTLMAIAQRHNLRVIEDCAQATGADWAGQRTGSIGDVGCFSFYPTKNLGACGDGGAVTTHDPAIAQALRVLRDHGRTGTYYHEELGVNSRLDAIQAAILSVKLPYLESWHEQRTTVANRYQDLITNLGLDQTIVLPQAPMGGRSVWNQYTIRLKGADAAQRDALRQKLQAQGVICMVYYPIPLHLQPVYQALGYQVGQLPIAEQAAQEVISLPMFPEMVAEMQQRVVQVLNDCLG